MENHEESQNNHEKPETLKMLSVLTNICVLGNRFLKQKTPEAAGDKSRAFGHRQMIKFDFGVGWGGVGCKPRFSRGSHRNALLFGVSVKGWV